LYDVVWNLLLFYGAAWLPVWGRYLQKPASRLMLFAANKVSLKGLKTPK